MSEAIEERSFLDSVSVKRIDTSNFSFNLDSFVDLLEDASKESKSLDIQIPDAERNSQANILAVLEIIKQAQKSINIFSGHINSHVYGQPHVMVELYEWLKEDSRRHINILLKKKFNLMDTLMGTMKLELPDRITIRNSLLEDIDQCFRNCIIADTSIIKLKESNPELNEDRIVVNFNAPQDAKELLALFNSLFIDKYSEEIVLTNDFKIKTNKNHLSSQIDKKYIENKFVNLNQIIHQYISLLQLQP